MLQDYALVCLAVVGDASVWNKVHDRFVAMLQRPVGQAHDAQYPSNRAAPVYLTHWASDHQRELLVDQIRRDWTKISSHRPDLTHWLQQEWPQVNPTARPANKVPLPQWKPSWPSRPSSQRTR